MDNFIFHSPTKFIFGEGEENNVGKYLKQAGAKKILVLYGGKSAVKSGLISRVETVIENEGLEFKSLGGIAPNPKADKVYEAITLIRENQLDFILAVGGGSVIDTGKAAAMGALYDGDFWDLYKDKTTVAVTEALPVGTVLTIAAAGSEGSSSSVISNDKGQKRGRSSELIRPVFSILNPALTQTLPPYQTAAGITDMIAHILERYFTNTKNVEVTDELCEALMRTAILEAPKVMADPNDYDARANMMWTGTLAHNNLCGVGREQDWASHHLEHELSGLYDVTHGAGLAVIFPAWMEYTLQNDPQRAARFANRVFGIPINSENPAQTGKAGIDAFRAFLKSIGMPLNFEQLGAKEADIPKLLDMLEIDKHTEGKYVVLNREDCKNIYEIAAHTPA